MTVFSFFSRAFHAHSSSKLLVLFSVSSGGLVALSESQAESDRPNAELCQTESKKRVVVLGTGWAGISFLKGLNSSMYDVQVVSPRNYFAFTPLLPSVTCGTVEARSIVEPIRNMIKKRSVDINFWEAECLKIDAENKRLFCRSNLDENLVGNNEFYLEYDYLIIAVGAQVNTFNTPGVSEYCYFLKEVEDAQRIRRSVIDCFEKAVLPGLSEEERRTNVHFVIVGGGPTGVEFAAELHDFVQEDLIKLYPSVKDLVKITVIQSGDHILNTLVAKCNERNGRLLRTFYFSSAPTLLVSQVCILGPAKGRAPVRSLPPGKTVSYDRQVRLELEGSDDFLFGGFCRFDERISSFAEQKFGRDGIEVLTGSRVISVSDKLINMKMKGEVLSMPHGMVVWSTGVGARPVVKDFMEQIGQGNRRVLATDEWLRVKGCRDVYALGDCATVDQRKIMEDILTIFKAADTDNSGTLSIEEFQAVVEDILERYPQVELFLKNKHLPHVTDLLKDAEGNERPEVDYEEFKSALSLVDLQTKCLPATAQVAAQQGAYLSRCFNHRKQCETNPEGPRRFRHSGRHQFHPFQYKHLGQFATLGGEQAGAELPGDWVSVGHSTQWLWYSVYAR